MLLNNLTKHEFTKKFKLHDNDCGSIEIQISSLSWDISLLTEHLKQYKKDFHSYLGLIKKVNKRKTLLKYLKRTNEKKYFFIITELNIRK